jgi:hypothetical protein
LSILKYRLKLGDCSFLTNGKSRYTFIKKTKAEHAEEIVDINMMAPLILKNCLPIPITLKYTDSSKIRHHDTLARNETKNLFCFTMSQNISMELSINGFKPVEATIFNLDDYKS